MFSALQSFVSRHRRKFIVGGIVISGGVLLLNYIKDKAKENLERENKELLELNLKSKHFEAVERLCNETAGILLKKLKISVSEIFKTASLIQKLKPGAKQISVWNELKVLSYAKVAAFVYASCFVMIMLRIQFGVIGGFMFRDERESGGNKKMTSSIQEEYFDVYDFFLNTELSNLCQLIQEKLEVILHKRSLKDEMTAFDAANVFLSLWYDLSNCDKSKNPFKNMSKYFIRPELRNGSHSNENFGKLIEATLDILESKEIYNIIIDTVSAPFDLIESKLYGNFIAKKNASARHIAEPGPSSSDSNSVTVNKTSADTKNSIRLPLAMVIPMINNLVENNGNDILDDLTVLLIERIPLKLMSANVYETFSSS